MSKIQNAVTPGALVNNTHGLFPEMSLMTGEQVRAYRTCMIKNEITLTPPTAGNFSGTVPEFGRWQDVQRIFGIKRGTLYNLVAEGQIKSVSLRRRGNVHGCRLFYLASISQYLNNLMETQQSQQSQ